LQRSRPLPAPQRQSPGVPGHELPRRGPLASTGDAGACPVGNPSCPPMGSDPAQQQRQTQQPRQQRPQPRQQRKQGWKQQQRSRPTPTPQHPPQEKSGQGSSRLVQSSLKGNAGTYPVDKPSRPLPLKGLAPTLPGSLARGPPRIRYH
jgi:hypothetical protein